MLCWRRPIISRAETISSVKPQVRPPSSRPAARYGGDNLTSSQPLLLSLSSTPLAPPPSFPPSGYPVQLLSFPFQTHSFLHLPSPTSNSWLSYHQSWPFLSHSPTILLSATSPPPQARGVLVDFCVLRSSGTSFVKWNLAVWFDLRQVSARPTSTYIWSCSGVRN